MVLEWRSWRNGSPTLKPLKSCRIWGSGVIWAASVGVCFPRAPPIADWVPACAGSGWGRQGEIWLTAPPQCASLSFLLWQLFLWVWVLRDSVCGFCVWGDLKGCVWGKSKLSLHVCMLWITHLDACPLTLCWLQFCSGKNSHGSV